ncbi:MAG: T9SS type A sorting domain-containing protein [Bacteroidales bacterium]|nr:T9SS type A sorting domain-containing protein [Bacteroidales bacterium]
MKKILCFVAVALTGVLVTFAQTVTLSFTGQNAANHYLQLDRVVITNLTKGWSETIYWPDTTLIMQNVTGIDESVANGGFGLSQNNPNPFIGTTDVNLTVAAAGAVTLEIVDGNGRIVETQNFASLQAGLNQFRITLSAAGTYVMTARQNGKTSSIKMVCNGAGNGNRIEYIGIVETPYYDVSTMVTATPKSHTRGTTANPFTFGDQMEYVGYAILNGEEIKSQHITQMQNASQTFVLLFPVASPFDSHPCSAERFITDFDNNIYNTVQIGNQCWMRENLRTTHYANGDTILEGGELLSENQPYRYTPHNDVNTISTYGYRYNWNAVMHGANSSETNPSGVQGICPDGWHVPSIAEWQQLSDYVSSVYAYRCDERESYIAKALASATDWGITNTTFDCVIGNNTEANNATGFSALPAGITAPDFNGFEYCIVFWSATVADEDYNFSWFRSLFSASATMDVWQRPQYSGFSVRCVRD